MTSGSAAAFAPTASVTSETVSRGLATPRDGKELIVERIYAISYEQQFDNPQFLIDLARHESVFLKYPKILDSNGKYSMGLYHWQEDSFNDHCVNHYGLPNDIMNIDVQTECAIMAIRDGLADSLWKNSMIKIRAGK